MSTMSSISGSSFGSTPVVSCCHIYYITSVILYIFSGHVTASQYYVSAVPNGVPCPTTNLPCHNLSYYVADYRSYFTDDTIFYFLKGTHTLQGILNISNVSNITLQGLGHIEQGFHETVMQSTSVIMCSDNNRTGIQFTSSRSIAMKFLVVANCTFDTYIYDRKISNSLHLVDIVNVTLDWVSVQNGSGFGLCLVNTFDVLINVSSFSNNGALEDSGGNAYVYYNGQINSLSRVNIMQSNFTLSLGYTIFLIHDTDIDVVIKHSMFSHNIGGGGILIDSHRNGSIEFLNCIVYNNTGQKYGGGVYIHSNEGNGCIEFHNCNIYSNTAQQYGGGVYIDSYEGSGSIMFHNCTIYNNTAQNDEGGGLYIYLDRYGNGTTKFHNCIIRINNALKLGGGASIHLHGNNSIAFSNCIIYSNTAQTYEGGGVFIYSDIYRNGRIEFFNCTIYNNTSQVHGGGVSIDLHEGSGSIMFCSCTIYSNSAQNDEGGGLYIYSNRYGNGRVEFYNCVIYNNTSPENGGGVSIHLHGNNSIEFSNSVIYSNTAQTYEGGGVFIYSDIYRNGRIEFFNCTIYNNTSQVHGGGVSIDLHEGSGSIMFCSCTIYSNSAQNDEGGGLYIYSNRYGNGRIEFYNCVIYNNTSQVHGGGVSIDLHEGSGSIMFCNCTIYSNSAQNDEGGGLYIYSNRYGNGRIEFYNCVIYNNTSAKNGGGVSIDLHGNNSIKFNNCTIYYNAVLEYGGGVFIYFYGEGSIEIQNCIIYNNTAQRFGGGVNIISHEYGSIKFINCTIYNNTAYFGSGLYLGASAAFPSTTSFRFINVSFHSNKIIIIHDVYQCAVVLVKIHDIIFDQIEVSNHNTTGLVSFNSLITFDKTSIFVNNSGVYGGGIALYKSSQLLLKEHTKISFLNNHASKSGGGIFVSQLLDADIRTNCTFQAIPYNASVGLFFVNNTANVSGDVLYGGEINDCRFNSIFHYPQQAGLSAVSSDPIQVCFCVSDKPNCSIPNMNITAMPGIGVNIPLATVGSLNGLTNGVIKLTSPDSSSTVQTDNNRLNATCTNVTFKLSANPDLLNATDIYATLESSIINPLQDHHAKIINVNIESCPIGFPLVNNTCVCRFELNTPPITCDINTQIITRDGGMWIGYKNDSDCLIVYQNCPFDYCNDDTIHFKVTSPNQQCLYNRSGLLCGQCADGLSLMLGSNQCGQCTNDYLALIVAFAVGGLALVAFLIALNLTVSVGTINGLIFYANVVKIYEPFFFPIGPIQVLSRFVSWVNLDLSVETCFYHNLSSCHKAWLQFVFPGYVWFILILIIILSQYSSKMVRLVGRQAIPVLATMILLSYTKLIRTVFQVLHYTNIQCRGENNVTLLRWYIDANVQYLRGCHLPLLLFSLAVLILLIVPYTFYLLTIPLIEGPLSKYMCCCQKLLKYMKPFFDAYGGPYKDKCRFWTGFLLLVRVVLALVVSLDIEATISLDVLTSVLIAIISMYFLFRGIYRHLPLACLEMSFFLNLMFMAYVNVQRCVKSKLSQELSIGMVSVSFVVFCGIILYHVWDRLLKSCFQKIITKVKRLYKAPAPFSNSDDTEIPLMPPGSPAYICKTSSVSVVSVVMRRESLLFNEDD